MTRKLLAWIVLPPLTLLTVVFAVANRQAVRVSLDPLPFAADLPLYAFGLGCVLLGLLAGGLGAWSRARRWRRQAAEARRRAERLEAELRQARERAGPAAAEPGPPAIAGRRG